MIFTATALYAGTVACGADCNGDGSVDVSDAVCVVRQVLQAPPSCDLGCRTCAQDDCVEFPIIVVNGVHYVCTALICSQQLGHCTDALFNNPNTHCMEFEP